MAGSITYVPGEFDVAAGQYLVKFEGHVDKPPFEGESRYGNNNEPRYGFRFRIIGPEGNPNVNKIIEQTTGTKVSGKSNLLRMLNMLKGSAIQANETIDPAAYIGTVFQLSYQVNPKSDVGNLHIESLQRPMMGGNGTHAVLGPGGTVAPSAPPAPPKPSAPPPWPPVKAGPPAVKVFDRPPLRQFWVREEGAEPRQMDEVKLAELLAASHADPATVPVCLVGETTWKTAADFQFKDTIPY